MAAWIGIKEGSGGGKRREQGRRGKLGTDIVWKEGGDEWGIIVEKIKGGGQGTYMLNEC